MRQRFRLVTFVLAVDTRSAEAKWSSLQVEWEVKLDSEVTFRQFLRTHVADEGERMAVLEVGHCDDITRESRRGRNSKVTTARQVKYELLARRHDLRSERRRSCASSGRAAEVEQLHGTLLGSGAKWIKRSIRERDTCVEAGLVGHEREQQVASTQIDVERGARCGSVAEARDRIRGRSCADVAQRGKAYVNSGGPRRGQILRGV